MHNDETMASWFIYMAGQANQAIDYRLFRDSLLIVPEEFGSGTASDSTPCGDIFPEPEKSRRHAELP